MIKILLLLPNPADGTSFYRSMAPFAGLRKDYPEIQYEVMLSQELLTWDTVTQFDCFFIQRPFAGVHVANAVLIRKMGKPLILDYDDNFFAVPKENLFYEVYNNPEHQKNISVMLNIASSVWVSTQFLKDEYCRRCSIAFEKVVVIPNAFDDYLFTGKDSLHAASFCEQPMSIMWRGGNTHIEDIRHYENEIVRVCKETNTPITFYGQDPRPFGMDYTHVPFKNIIDYFEILRCRKHQICIVPLVPCDFNHAKSNVAFIEATYAGAVTLAPEWDEWDENFGMENYFHKDNFYHALKGLIDPVQNLAQLHGVAKNYILEHLLLSDINDLRTESIEKLTQ